VQTKIVFLVRHAESESNAGLRTENPSGIALTSRGRQQALFVRDALRLRPRLIVRSNYIRTFQTAQPLLESLSEPEASIWPVHEFSYLDVDRCANTNYEERTRWRDEYWDRLDPMLVDGKGAESFLDFMKRVDHALDELRREPADPIAVFTHGIFIRGMMLRAKYPNLPICSETMALFHRVRSALPIPNASVTEMLVIDGNISIGRTSVDHIPPEMRTG